MRGDYAEVFRDPAAAERYERVVYAPDTYASILNHRQLRYLRTLVGRWFPTDPPVQHDFACGTGRVIRQLHGLVRQAHGYDTSEAMLDKAREVGTGATLHLVATDGPVPEPAPVAGPAVVTVFRLLLNAEPAVRERAVAFAARALPDPGAGLLVLENHGNRSSLRHLRRRQRAGDEWFRELSHRDVTGLLARHGFTVVERRGFTLFPRGWYRRRWLRPLARLVDAAVTRLPAASRWAVNVLYVARRTADHPPER